MAPKQSEKFYWSSLKKVVDALATEGIRSELFAEGTYDSRLESVNEFPKGTVGWLFDKTDMAKAKKILGNTCCISGNVSSSLMVPGGPKEVKEYCRKVIEVCAPGGGFIMGSSCSLDEIKIENVKAMVETTRQYGTYR
jgi:uroporphyrinogen-III decarboxylase